MTYRIIILGKRNESMNHDECIEYLEQEHKSIINQLPELQRFSVSIPLEPDEAGYDEMTELCFKTEEDLKSAISSEVWRRAITDAENFVDLDDSEMVRVEDETVLFRPIPSDI
jgi:uncharacterized protein (TIGR02118 family)